MLYLYCCQGNGLSSLIRAFCGESEWALKNNYKYALLDPDTVCLPKNTCHPEKLIGLIKGEISVVSTTQKRPFLSEDQSRDPNGKENSKTNCRPNTQKSLAFKILEENDIVLVPQMGAVRLW